MGFWAHSGGYCLFSGPHWLMGKGRRQFTALWPSPKGFSQSQSRERERKRKRAGSHNNLILGVTSHDFWCALFVSSESLDQGERLSKGLNITGLGGGTLTA